MDTISGSISLPSHKDSMVSTTLCTNHVSVVHVHVHPVTIAYIIVLHMCQYISNLPLHDMLNAGQLHLYRHVIIILPKCSILHKIVNTVSCMISLSHPLHKLPSFSPSTTHGMHFSVAAVRGWLTTLAIDVAVGE